MSVPGASVAWLEPDAPRALGVGFACWNLSIVHQRIPFLSSGAVAAVAAVWAQVRTTGCDPLHFLSQGLGPSAHPARVRVSTQSRQARPPSLARAPGRAQFFLPRNTTRVQVLCETRASVGAGMTGSPSHTCS